MMNARTFFTPARLIRRCLILLALLAAPLVVSACASMSEDECRVADWQRTGYADGAAGEDQDTIASYTSDCAKAGVRPDAKAWRAGWDQGIKTYCTPVRGWEEGVDGNSWKSDVCRGQPQGAAFERALRDGLKVSETRRDLQNNDFRINELERKLQKAQKDDERRSLRDQIRNLDRQQSTLRDLLSRQEKLKP